MTPYYHVGHMCIVNTNWQYEVARFTVAFSHEETAVLAFIQQQLLSILAHYVTMKPPEYQAIALCFISKHFK